jgi:hypothetical protein
MYSVPHFGDLGLICFLITSLATTHLCYLGPEIDFLITGLSYIQFSYNRKILSNNKEQFCRDPASPFLISGFSYIRLSYKRSALYMSHMRGYMNYNMVHDIIHIFASLYR